ncbi:hypothetical protein [Microbacterium kunmingense]|uniref:hypothetical protein n=1 Tax=Microbacterium kunmingense TaxID=2915939 RepID=UPI0020048057|nr:hypothetical protein [Microbacterium kunmingense]
MRETVIGDRCITVTHDQTETTEYGVIQRFLVGVSGSNAVTHLSILRPSAVVDARVVASAIDTELLLEYEGSADSGLLRDPDIRLWRDQHRRLVEETLDRLRDEARDLPPEPMSDMERLLLRAFDTSGDDEVRGA